MGRKIKVNWTALSGLGNKTANNCEELEKCRVNIETIIASTSTCWQGVDSENFRTNAGSYLESLKNHTEHIDTWARFFKRASARYNDGVDDGVNRVKYISQDYDPQSFGR